MPREDKSAKTEPPSGKRIKEAINQGRVARSHDVSTWASVLVGTFLVQWIFNNAEHRILELVAQATRVMDDPSTAGAVAVLTAGLKTVVIVILPVGGIFALLAVVVSVAQTGKAVSLMAAKPRFSRINPKSGIQRLFGVQTAVQALKQVAKLTVLIFAGYSAIRGLVTSVTGTAPVGLGPILGATAVSIIGFVRRVALIGLVIGLGDYGFQRHKLKQSLKMTKAEVKEDAKAAEGNPAVKAELKKRQYAILRSSMKKAMRSADVVITNPTHYAVALQYMPGAGSARVVAKGTDNMAKMIRERAVEEDVPIVEDAPLARYLYVVCEVDQQIPAEIYFAVAKLLAFVYSLPAAVRTMRVHKGLPSQLPEVLAAVESLPLSRRHRAEAVLTGASR